MAIIEPGPGDATTEGHGLLRTMRWYDGFIVCLSASGFMLSTLGYSIGALGALGALILWAISVVIGGLQSYVFSEPATMFPDHSGGLAAYAREAWRRRVNLLSPISGFAYWIAFTSTFAVFGLIAAQLIQAQWFAGQTWTIDIGFLRIGFAQVLACVIIIVVWTINVAGMRPTKVFGYVTGVIFVGVLILFFVLPFITGHWDSSFMTSNLFDGGLSWQSIQIILVWLYLMGWSSYPTEQAATFAPEYHDPLHDTRKGLLSAATFALGAFVLVPLALGGVLSQDAIGADPVAFYVTELQLMIGSVGSGVAVILIVVACLLTMNASTMNASRALYSTAQKGYSVRIFAKLNASKVPANAMTLDMLVNIFVVLILNSVIGIIAASNMAYFVVIILALGGVALLRIDLPNRKRPIRLKPIWIIVAVTLAILNLSMLIVGSLSFELTGYGGIGTFFFGLGAIIFGLVLYLWRVLVQDKSKILWRDPHNEPGDLG